MSSTIRVMELLYYAAVAWIPHAYQKRAVRWLLEHAVAGLFLDPGLGKTSICLAAIKVLKRKGLIDRVLIIAPLRVAHEVWPVEIETWTDFADMKCVVLHGPDKNEALLDVDADIWLINPEGLTWLLSKKRFRRLRPDLLILDESSKFKNSQTERFKALKPFLKYFRRRWILTGSPAPNGLLDLFGQVYIMDQGLSLGQYITHYRNEFFDQHGFHWRVREGAEKRIYKILKKFVLRMDAEDYMTLPELVINNVKVTLPPDARKVYDEMEDEMFAIIDGTDKITAVSAGAASIKCEQIANGAVYKDAIQRAQARTKSEKWLELHDVKIEAVKEYVAERAGQPTLIAYHFQHDLQRLQHAFGKDIPVLAGGAKNGDLIRAWNAGEIPLMFVQPQSMGHGLNMQKSGDSILWFAPIWDYEIWDQTIRRLRRQGSVNLRIIVTHIIARDTVDEAKILALTTKGRNERRLLDALKTYRKTRAARKAA